MLRSAKEIKGAQVHARDGQIGPVRTLYFDDESWRVRHLVVGAGNNLLSGRDVLLPPEAVRQEARTGRVFVLRSGLTTEEVKNAPEATTDPPVAVQKRSAHLAASPYHPVTGEGTLAPAGAPLDARTLDAMGWLAPGEGDGALGSGVPRGDPHLRSTREVRGYRVRGRDGGIGHVEDFVVDTERWTIRYVAVDTKNWLPGKKVLAAAPWVLGINWAEAEISVDLGSIEVEEAPAWDADVPVDRAYEEKLREHYCRAVYRARGDAYGG